MIKADPVAEPTEEHIQRIIRALDGRKNYPEDKKREFAITILQELDWSHYFGMQAAKLPDTLERLVQLSETAEKAVGEILHEVKTSFEARFADGLACSHILQRNVIEDGKIDTTGIMLEPFLWYLQTFKVYVKSKKVPPKKRGPKNLTPLATAKMIAAQYKKILNDNPTHGKNSKIGNIDGEISFKDLPFDRVCNEIEDMTGGAVRMSSSTRLDAIKVVLLSGDS